MATNGELVPSSGITKLMVKFSLGVPRMSALDQKQTCAPQNVMSALPPTATAKADTLQW
jgi:hypothetical protein